MTFDILTKICNYSDRCQDIYDSADLQCETQDGYYSWHAHDDKDNSSDTEECSPECIAIMTTAVAEITKLLKSIELLEAELLNTELNKVPSIGNELTITEIQTRISKNAAELAAHTANTTALKSARSAHVKCVSVVDTITAKLQVAKANQINLNLTLDNIRSNPHTDYDMHKANRKLQTIAYISAIAACQAEELEYARHIAKINLNKRIQLSQVIYAKHAFDTQKITDEGIKYKNMLRLATCKATSQKLANRLCSTSDIKNLIRELERKIFGW